MKPRGIKLGTILNAKIVSILTAIFVVSTMFAVSVSNNEPALDDVVFEDIVTEELDTEVELEAAEELSIEDFEISDGLPPDAIVEFLDPMVQGGIVPSVYDDTMYAYNTWDPNGAFTRGPAYFSLSDPGTITSHAATISSNFLSGGTWTNDGKWLGVQYGIGNGDLWEINPDTGAMTSIGGGGVSLSGLAYDPVTGKLYGAASYDLYEVNIADGSQTLIGNYGGAMMIGIAFDQYGVLYGWDISQDKLWTVDTSSGAATEVGPLTVGGQNINLNYAQDGAFDYDDDTLYLNAYTLSPNSGSYFYKCDEDTAVCTLVGAMDGGSEVTASAIPYSLAPGGTTTIQLGSDNPQYAGQGMGRSYKSGTYYQSYASYYAYPYQSSYEYRGWAVFDLADLTEWSGVNVKDAKLLIHNYYRYYAKDIGFTALTTTPYEYPGSAKSKAIFDESGPSGTQIGQYVGTALRDTTRHTITVNLNAAAVTRLNSILSGSPTYYTFGVGMDVQTIHPGYSYGYARWMDIRLVVTFDHSGELTQTQSGQGIALGDDWTGRVYKSSSGSTYNYPDGYMYVRKYTTYEYRNYAQWEVNKIAEVLPGGAVTIKKVSLRFNHQYSTQSGLYVYPMKYDVKTASASNLFTDCADGAQYYGPGSVTSVDSEYTWDLGAGGVTDLQDALVKHKRSFAVCMITTSTSGYSYNYGPRLVIEWESIVGIPPVADAGSDHTVNEGEEVLLNGSASNASGGAQLASFEWDYESDGTIDYIESISPTTTKTVVLGSDNPQYGGHAMGYTYRTSTNYYYCYAAYYAYPYLYTTWERRGWTTFDLADLQWPDTTAVSAKLVIHNYYRYYARELVFTALTTTPYDYPGTTISKAVFDESGPGGTEIGSYIGTSTYDSTRHTIEVDLNAAAVTAINNVLSGSPTYYTFGVGIYVKSLHPGYTSGYARWTDIRLEVTFDYSSELTETQSGQGVAFGDDWTGRVYKSSTGTTYNYPDGYMYIRTYTTYTYRGYAQWDLDKIAEALPSGAKIQAVALRFNHQYSSQSSNYVYQMEYDVKTASPDQIHTDAGDGTQYAGPYSVSSTDSEYTWDLGASAVTDLQDALDSNNYYFGVGMISTSTTGYSYNYGPRLVLEWKAPGGGGGATLSGLARHTYGDNGVYTVTLRVTDDLGQTDTDTCEVTVLNVNPVITPIGLFTADEGIPFSVSATVTDEGSDDLQFEWTYELGPTLTNMQYNDGMGPDPYPSPWGTFPFIVTDSAIHTYGDNGVYRLMLTVTDDDGGSATLGTTITVFNVAPTIIPFGPLAINEGSPFSINAMATDRGSDDLTFDWDLELGPSASTTYYNNPMVIPDPPKSPWGIFPFSATDTHGHTYGDNGVYAITLIVTDDDGASTVYTTTITVYNVAPSVSVEAYIKVNFTLRVSGEKWHNVELYVTSGGTAVAYADVLRMPGDPDDQAITLTGVKCDVTNRIGLRVVYTPFDDVINGQINGADPAWVTIQFESGDEYVFDNTFNYKQPHRWDWMFDINQYLIGQPITFEGHATDPGSDDLTFEWNWGDGPLVEGAIYYNDGVGPDPAKSPDGIFPFTVDELRIHTYWTNANFPLVLTVSDDDAGVTAIVVIIVII